MAVDFGIILELNGEIVPLKPVLESVKNKTFHAMLHGKRYVLPKPVNLGTPADLEKFLKDKFGITPPDSNSFPSPLNTVYGKFRGLSLIVEELELTIPPTKQIKGGVTKEEKDLVLTDLEDIPTAASTSYTLGLSAQWIEPGDGVTLIKDKLSIKGMYFRVTYPDPPVHNTDPPVDNTESSRA